MRSRQWPSYLDCWVDFDDTRLPACQDSSSSWFLSSQTWPCSSSGSSILPWPCSALTNKLGYSLPSYLSCLFKVSGIASWSNSWSSKSPFKLVPLDRTVVLLPNSLLGGREVGSTCLVMCDYCRKPFGVIRRCRGQVPIVLCSESINHAVSCVLMCTTPGFTRWLWWCVWISILKKSRFNQFDFQSWKTVCSLINYRTYVWIVTWSTHEVEDMSMYNVHAFTRTN